MKHISQLLVDVAKYLANPRIEAAAWEARHAQVEPEECDPFCWCLDCQPKFEEEAEKWDFTDYYACSTCRKRYEGLNINACPKCDDWWY
jgi:hypothetical protein